MFGPIKLPDHSQEILGTVTYCKHKVAEFAVHGTHLAWVANGAKSTHKTFSNNHPLFVD